MSIGYDSGLSYLLLASDRKDKKMINGNFNGCSYPISRGIKDLSSQNQKQYHCGLIREKPNDPLI